MTRFSTVNSQTICIPGQLHLTPLELVLQLRPSFGYIDEADAKEKENKKKKKEEEEAEEIDEDNEEDDDIKPYQVQVQFKKRESEKAAAARLQSHAYLKQLSDEEPWVELQFFNQHVCIVNSRLVAFVTGLHCSLWSQQTHSTGYFLQHKQRSISK